MTPAVDALHPALPAYAELHVRSCMSFQIGASHPHELVARAHALGYHALALTDECSVAGVVRAHTEARRLGMRLIPGAEFGVPHGAQGAATTPENLPPWRLVVLPTNVQGWGHLCEFITTARRAAVKGSYQVDWEGSDWASLQHCELLLAPARETRAALTLEALVARLLWLRQRAPERVWLALELLHGPDDALWQHRAQTAARLAAVPLVAAGDVLMHVRSRKPLHDVLTAIRLGRPVTQCGQALLPNAEAHLRSRQRLANLYPATALAHTLVLAQRCHFSLDDIRYQYPTELLQEHAAQGWDAATTLRHCTDEGAARRYPQGVPQAVQQQIEHELALISELRYEMYFLTVYDIVRFARAQGILCQGRGSAANSAVCYCLGITEVDPARMNTLFERFISRERNEPPDIDVDFEHQRREEVIQYLYRRYGRERAAIAATVIRYQPRSALRDAARALDMPAALADAVARRHVWFDGKHLDGDRAAQRLREAGADPDDPKVQQWLQMAGELLGLPRHLSQHVGGFVLTQDKLTRLVPVENAAMPERSIIQWDKDDLDAMGLLKVDVLALGMLSAIRRCLDFIGQRRGRPMQLQDIPAEDPATYDMICAADTVGVFQIESRAQMAMLPRLRPRTFYDLVIEVAIVRPGPIQGGMVHPYLRRRNAQEAEHYPSEALRSALSRTLGVPIFQEQVMQIAMLAAGFSADEADTLRRSMAAWKRKGGVHKFYDRIVGGMVERGYTPEFAQQIFSQIEGFGEYGFPESHAASFALLVYASCWLKCHEPACFLAAMLNAQPLGFYTPSQLVQDAQRHGVEVRPVDVRHSHWDCTLEKSGSDSNSSVELVSDPDLSAVSAVRLGLRLVSGLSVAGAQRLVQARNRQAFVSVEDLASRACLGARDLRVLAQADALAALSGHRRHQLWQVAGWQPPAALFADVPEPSVELEPGLQLAAPGEGEEVVADLASTGLSLRAHPLALLRERLAGQRWRSAAQLQLLADGQHARACGLVTMRQQPSTAKGVVFVTLEDETGSVNVIVWKALRERQRPELLQSRLLGVQGRWQRDEASGGQVRHLIAQRLHDLTPWLGLLADAPLKSRDFR